VAIDVIHDFNQEALRGHIHLVKSGPVQAIGIQTDALHSTAPTLLFLPRPNTHRLLTDEKSGADVVCATVQFGGGGKNRITDSLPGIVLVELADHRLAKTLSAIHDDPACARDLSSMAALADMSRARFALHSKEITGETPADYLASWRLMRAKDLLKRGRPLKHVADDVGDASASAFTRALIRKVGCSPTSWLNNIQEKA
jgi:AraC-like DNA-binding protein